jgi:methionine-rich copper-binding protein CopC
MNFFRFFSSKRLDKVPYNGSRRKGNRLPRKTPVRLVLEALEDRTAPAVLTIAQENALAGTPPSQWDISGSGDSTLQGFATDISVDQGQTVFFKINDTARASYHIDLYRMGYYQGNGARLVATIPSSQPLKQVQPNPLKDAATGLIDCGNWAVSASWAVPSDATSGIYFAKLIRDDTGGSSHVFFIVRSDASHSQLLFQTSDATWEAYNTYGGNSLYQGTAPSSDGRAYKVSYNRPFSDRGTSGGLGTYNWVFHGEYPMVRWLESNGYDVSYFTDMDSDRNGALIKNHQTFLSVGHDEYWSGGQRANVQAARDAGVNLAFFSGNEGFWKTRWENSIDGSGTPYRTLVCYKETKTETGIATRLDPTGIWTGTWRDPTFSPPADGGRPENALNGTIFMVNRGPVEIGTTITVPYADGQLRLWRNTSVASLSPGQSATLSDLVLGYEWDEDLDNGSRPAGLFHLSTTTVSVPELLQDYGNTYTPGNATHSLTMYRAASGALVFGAGTVQWQWGLDANHDDGSSLVDVRMQQATVNLLADMGAQPATLQSGLVAATASADHTAPTSTITSPAAGAAIQSGTTVTITGTAVDAGGGAVAGVEVSTDGGNTWHPATGRASWSYTWSPNGLGQVTIKVRAVDDSGNLETPSAGVTVNVAGPISLWSSSTVPTVVSDGDASSTELGVKFRSDVSAYVLGVRFYKGSTNTGTHVGSLWTSTGTLLASATFTGETSTGWQQVLFSSPVPIAANTTYVVSYHAPNGHYSEDDGYFASTGVTNGPLHALAAGVDGPNGVYAYGSGSVFPTSNYQSANYWVDVVYNTTATDNTPPAVSSKSPASGATNVATTTTVTATFTEPVQAATISFVLKDSGGNVVASSLSYNSGTFTATLTPGAALANSATYTATVSGALDTAGNQMAPVSWSFTTAAPLGAGPYSIWSASAAPGTASDPDSSSTELGVKFRSDVAGYVTGVRFYKGSTNTGTHVGSLWSSTGTLLAQATFTGETATGWQQVLFSSPVAIAANTTYVASYHAPNGHYAEDDNFFASTGVDNYPLHALAAGVDGPNGVYAYGSGSVFPSNDYLSANYWVDVVFTTSTSDTTPPTVTGRSPAAGATGVSIGTAVTATFSESVQPGTISFVLKDAGGNIVPAGLSYTAGTNTATLTPNAALSASTTYTATVSGAQDLAGNTMTAVSWSFTTAVADTTPPTVTSSSPAAGATNVATSTAVTATFSEPVQSGTISFVLKDAGNNAVPASLSYNATTLTATLTPSAALAAATTYTATVSGAQDPSGNVMSPVSWSFTTTAVGAGPFSIWSASAAPVTAANPDTSSTELGVKFRSDSAGYIIGVRFYKGSTNTGTHVGSLWSSTGTLLAQATFTNETASGWQEVVFSAPVAIAANTTYVASYHAPNGHYAEDDNFFASGGVDNGPLHALAAGVDGANGVYAYGSSSLFPSSNYLSANYWVDVVFSPNVWMQNTAADFSTGTGTNVAVTNTSGGELQLASALSDEFTGTALGSAWATTKWVTSGSATVSNGILTVLGAHVDSVQTFTNTGVEARLTIGAAANQLFGLATSVATSTGNYWAVFTTKGTTGTLYAEVNVAGTLTDVSLGKLPTGYHAYKVQPVSGGFQFYLDGTLKTTISTTFPSGTALHVSLSAKSGSPKPAMLADWVHVLAYASSGVYTSAVFDATRIVNWGTVNWDALLPAGTSIQVETSSGDTATPDGTWSAWSQVTDGGAITSPPARYLRYRITLTTSDPSLTPTLLDIFFTWS